MRTLPRKKGRRIDSISTSLLICLRDLFFLLIVIVVYLKINHLESNGREEKKENSKPMTSIDKYNNNSCVVFSLSSNFFVISSYLIRLLLPHILFFVVI